MDTINTPVGALILIDSIIIDDVELGLFVNDSETATFFSRT